MSWNGAASLPGSQTIESERCRRNEPPLRWLSYALAAAGLLLLAQNRLSPGAPPDPSQPPAYDLLYLYLLSVGLAFQPSYRLLARRSTVAGRARMQLAFAVLAVLGALGLAVVDILRGSPDLSAYVLALVFGAFIYRGRRPALVAGCAAVYSGFVAAVTAAGKASPALLVQGAVYAGAAVLIALVLEREFERSVRTAESLRRSEERFRSLFDRNEAVMLAVDPATVTILEVNGAAQRFYGYAREQLSGLSLERLSLLPAHRIREELERAQRNSRHPSVFQQRLAGGEIRTVEMHVSPIEHEGRTLLYTIVHDVTERTRTEEELRKLSQAVTQAATPIVVTDLEANIEYVNPAFTAVTGYSAEEARGRNPRLLKSEHTPPETHRQMWDTLTAGGVWRGEFRNRRKDGTLYWEKAIILPLTDASGRRTHYLGIKEDITEHRYMMEALKTSNRLLEEAGARAASLAAKAETANRTKTEFLANTSHELRTPLTAILGFSEILSTGLGGPLTERQKRYVDSIHESGKHLLALINDILDLSKVDHGSMHLEVERVDFPALAESCLNIVREKAVRKGLVLIAELPPDREALCLQADERKLRQVLYNLLANAVKFTPAGGRVALGARREGEQLSFYVQDTGIGIPVEDQERIFDEFYQAKNQTTGEIPGTGLGLALSRRLLALHGGRIRVESGGPGAGSRFICTLPLCPPVLPGGTAGAI